MSVDLEAHARTIPHMGGRRIGPYLRKLAREADKDTAIVELGCWLGAGTAQLAMGLRERSAPDRVDIHCFDNFQTSESSARKARDQGAPEITEGSDTRPWVERTLAPFEAPIHFHKGMLQHAEWGGRPISVFIDDASKYTHTFVHCLKVFGPSWTPGAIILLMDFYLFRKRRDLTPERLASMKGQFDFVQEHSEHFQQLPELEDSSCAAFRYAKPMDFDALEEPEFLVRRAKQRDALSS